MRTCSIFCVIALLVLAGCKPEEKPAPKVEPPPEPTPEMIAGEIRQALGPMAGVLQGGALTDDVKNQVVAAMKAAKAKNISENGKAAVAIVSHDLEQIITQAREQKRWKLVLGGIEAWEALMPGSPKMERYKARATLYMSRPNVRLKGFFQDKQTGDTYAFLDVETMPDHQHHDQKARKGDEFLGLRFVDIVGDNTGVNLEYLAIPGETFRVMNEKKK